MWTVEQIANAMALRWGEGATWLREGNSSAHEAGLLKLDSGRARALLGWRPRLRMDTALGWLVDWYKAWRDGADMQSFTVEQIAAYERAGQSAQCL